MIKFSCLVVLVIFFSCTNKSPQEKAETSSVRNLSKLEGSEINKVHQSIRSDITTSITSMDYDGIAKRQIIQDHVVELFMNNDLGIPSNPVKLVRENRKAYSTFLDPGDFVQYDDKLARMIDSLYEVDQDFRRQLVLSQIQTFEKVLEKKANVGFFDPVLNPSDYAKAYSIYNRFGSEALTDYVNILQHYDPGASTQDNSVSIAFYRFTRSSVYQESNPVIYAEEFVRYK